MTDVSETDVAQQLRLFEAIASTTTDFLYAFDLEGRLLYANRRLLEVMGVSAEEAVGKELRELGYPQWHAEMHAQELRQVIETKKPVRGQVPFTGGSGISGVYEYLFHPVLDRDGKVEMVIGTTRDVTDRAQVEDALRRSRARLKLAVDAMHLGLWAVDLPGGEVEESDEFVALLGLAKGTRHQTAEEWRKYLHPEDAPRAWAKFEGALAGASEYDDEHRLVGADGVTRWVHVKGSVIRDEQKRPVRMIGVVADVTRRKADERAQAHLAAIVESSDDAIVSKTLEGIIQSWNAGARRIFGYESHETVGRSVLMLLPPERHHEEAVILARLRNGERIDHYESVRVTKDGRHIDVSLTISPVKDASGRIIGASKIARDITRQKRAERELQAAKELAEEATRRKEALLESERAARVELERAGRMKDEFLATLSHELRTPLNAIMGWAQILTKSPLPEDVAEGVQIIERNARAQTQIIEDLLDMSRIISGKIRLDVQQRVDLRQVVAAAVETVRPTAENKGVRLVSVLDAMAGPVSGDANRLQQVFWNLLTNAVKFTPRGGRVQVVLERVNSHLEVSVIDTGEGIEPAFLPHVFDRFRQADAGTTRKHGGLGLGLAIVKQLVELHGGRVRVKSGGLGCGSTFIVALPLTVIHPEPEPPEAERRHPALGALPLSADTCAQVEGVKVLVVDDEPDARLLVRRLLEDCKADVRTAGSCAEAVEALRADPPDVLISDVGMPEEDGYDLIRRVRALPLQEGGNVPAIALTAYARAEDRMKAILAGFQQHVVKPVEPAELITLVAILGTSKSRRR